MRDEGRRGAGKTAGRRNSFGRDCRLHHRMIAVAIIIRILRTWGLVAELVAELGVLRRNLWRNSGFGGGTCGGARGVVAELVWRNTVFWPQVPPQCPKF